MDFQLSASFCFSAVLDMLKFDSVSIISVVGLEEGDDGM